MKKITPLIALCTMLPIVSSAEDTSIELENATVVAVANKQERPISDVIGSVTVIGAENITNTNSENMADALRYQSNIHMEDAGTRFGSTGINIRGVGKNRVAVEVDGIKNAKQYVISSYSNAASQFPETDIIKNIEILNGPASTLYGSDAIGGVVSIQTWNPEDLTSRSDNGRYNKIRLGYDGKTHGRVITGLTAWDNSNNGGIVSFTQRDGKGLINHNSLNNIRDFSDWDQQSLFTKFVINTTGSNTLKFAFSGSQKDNKTQINSFLGQARFSRTTEILTDDNNNNHNLNMNYGFAIENNIFDDGTFNAYFSRTKVEQNTFEKRSSRRGAPLAQFRQFNYDQKNIGLELNLTKKYSTDNSIHNIIYGLEYTSADIEEFRDGTQTNLTTGITVPSIIGESFPRRDFPNSKVNEVGLFILDEISLNNSNWTIIPGIRIDYYDLKPTRDALLDVLGDDFSVTTVNEINVSPKLGALYTINDNSNIYAQYVRGFRAPPFDDVNVGLFNALFHLQAIPNPDLKAETSNGFEIGYRYFSEKTNASVSLFNTDYNNFIETKARIGIDPDTGFLLFQSRNIDEANIYGIELTHNWQITDSISSNSSLAWTRGDNKTSSQPLNTISPAKAVNNLSWTSENNLWNIDLYTTFVKSKSRIDETDPRDDFFKTSGYTVFDLFIKHTIGKSQKIQFGIFNLTNKLHWDWQQVRQFDAHEPIIDALSLPSRSVSLSYTLTL